VPAIPDRLIGLHPRGWPTESERIVKTRKPKPIRRAGEFPSFDLSGRVALVTGAGRGLGAAIARALANAGADVALGLRDGDAGAVLVGEITRMGRQALALQMDVTRRDQIERAVATAVKRFGRIDILVNNVGGGVIRAIEDVSEQDFDQVMALNVKSTFLCSQVVGRVMRKQRYGRIVNMSSQAGFVALPTESVYCGAKAAVSHLTKCFAVEWGRHNITVNAVAPTFIRTPGTEAALSDKAFRADTIERIAALHRVGEPVEVAGAVVFLASSAASLVTGTTLMIDGGWTAR
jgi:NAD(P)-dependent dehydrogenase (short-subunit alcohol dehydrogenase family)